MLSIDYISKILADKQLDIESYYFKQINSFERNTIELDKYQLNLYTSLTEIFEKNIDKFYIDNNLYKNNSAVFTLINSILVIIDEYININSEYEKEIIIKELLTNMDNDLFQKDLYNIYEYNKNKSFNKSDIMSALKNSLQFIECDNFNLIKRYLSDYLKINIFILCVENKQLNFANSEKYLPKYYNDKINKFLPNFIIIHENNIYKPVLMHNKELLGKSSSILYSNYKDIIENIWTYFKIKDINPLYPTIVSIKNLKIDELKNLCIENNIDLKKKSDRSTNMVNKIKNDLILDLVNYYNLG